MVAGYRAILRLRYFLSAMVWLSAVLGLSPQATAGSGLDAAHIAFDRGDFREAAALARAEGSAGAYAFAARSLIAYGDYVAPAAEAVGIMRQAQADAAEALRLDPSLAAAHVYAALAIGFSARAEGGLAAHFQGLATQARGHIDRAIELDPRDAWAWAIRGGWNLEIIYAGGIFGERLYGASVDDGYRAYARALELDPESTLIRYQYALQLAALRGPDAEKRARTQLAFIISSVPSDAIGKYTRDAALELDQAIASGRSGPVLAIVRKRMGYSAVAMGGGPGTPKSLRGAR